MNDIKLICFDLGNSLIKDTSWLDLNLAMGLTKAEHSFLYELYKSDVMSYVEWVELLTRIYVKQGATKADMEKAIKNYTFLPGAKSTIKQLRTKGYEVVLISGAMNILVDRVAAELGVHHAGSNTIFVFNRRGRLQHTDVSSDDETSKLAQLELIARGHGFKLQNCACVGDGINDTALFKATKRGVTFTGSPIENKAWRVVDNLAELQKIF